MNFEELNDFMRMTFEEVMDTREAGQHEYANGDDAFSNFNGLAKELDLNRKEVLWVYAMKHKDGIASYLRGNISQREDVTGRIKDLIVYLFLLWGMIHEDRLPPPSPMTNVYGPSLAQQQQQFGPLGQLGNSFGLR